MKCKQIQLCSDSIHLLLLQPWDFLSRLKIGRTFENQICCLKNFKLLPYTNNKKESLLTRLIRCSNPKHGPDLVEFVIYRPDHPVPPGTTFDPFGTGECSCYFKKPNPKTKCKMVRAYEKALTKYEKRKKSYPKDQFEKTRRTSVPCLSETNKERGKSLYLINV